MERERENVYLLVHSQNAHNNWRYTRLAPEAKSLVSHLCLRCEYGAQGLEPAPASPSSHPPGASSDLEVEQPGIETAPINVGLTQCATADPMDTF